MVKVDTKFISLNISVFVISDTRNERSDKSGKVLEDHITKSGHKVFEKKFSDKIVSMSKYNIYLVFEFLIPQLIPAPFPKFLFLMILILRFLGTFIRSNVRSCE